MTLKPLQIGSLSVEAPVFMAPMTGVTDLPFRRMARRFWSGLLFTEMIASRPMLDDFRAGRLRPIRYDEEAPIAVQLAGCDPQMMAEAAIVHADHGAAMIDINFGCPVKKVVNNLAGSALMKDEPLACRIMEAVRNAVSVPVTVKMRLGWDEGSLNAPALARRAEEIGLNMVTVHGRTRNQLYNGRADWSAVHRVRDAVSVPLIVNGDILSANDAREAMTQSGADGVMVGRGVFGSPWLIRDIVLGLQGRVVPEVSLAARRQIIQDHYLEMIDYYGPRGGTGIARKHLGWYLKDLDGSDELRGILNSLTDPRQVTDHIEEFFARYNAA